MASIRRVLLCSAALLGHHACGAHAAISVPTAADMDYLTSQSIRFDGKLVGAWRITDRSGEHVLVLSRKAGPWPAGTASARIENIDLAALYYTRHEPGRWRQDWAIRDHSDCPGLDVAGDFLQAAITFTDLNNDGQAEVTIPYRLFCGGGIEPYTVKVILREGATKLAIRGESLVRYPGQTPFGGEHKYDKALLAPERSAYKIHMDSVWRKASDDQRR